MDKVNTPVKKMQYALKRPPKAEESQKKHKTEMCRKWESGNCEFGSKCAFAHGKHELKPKLDRPLKYKTAKCKNFFNEGFCLYGPRCQFSHKDNSDRTAPNTPVRSRNNSKDHSKRRLPVFIALERRCN